MNPLFAVIPSQQHFTLEQEVEPPFSNEDLTSKTNGLAVEKIHVSLTNDQNSLGFIREESKEEFPNTFLRKGIAKWKGKKTRDQIITTNQMYAILKNNVPEDETFNIRDLSRILAREMNKIMDNKAHYKGKCVLLLPEHKKTYPYSFIAGHTELLNFKNYTACLEISDEFDKIDLFIIFNKNALIKAGTYKEVYDAQMITIPLFVRKKYNHFLKMDVYERIGKCEKMVLIKPKAGNLFHIKKGMCIQEKLAKLAPEAQVVSPFTAFKPFVSESDSAKIGQLFRQKKYGHDLEEVTKIHQKSLPAKFNDELSFTLRDVMREMISIARSLKSWHQVNFIHGDVKPSNILLHATDKNTFKFLLADFDLTQQPGVGIINQNYPFWDEARRRGLTTPFADVYGLTMTLGETIIPSFTSSTCELFIDIYGQLLFLVKMLEHHSKFCFNHIIEQNLTYLKRHELLIKRVSEIEKELEDQFKHGSIQEKSEAKRLLVTILATRKILQLIVEIVAMNRNLIQIDVQHYPVMETISKNKLSLLKTNVALFEEVHNIFIYNDFFINEIFNKLSQKEKREKNFQALQTIIDHCRNNSSVDQVELNKILKTIQLRISALAFINRLNLLSEQDKEKHPLYYYLSNFLEFDSEKSADYLRTEIETIDVREELKSYLKIDESLSLKHAIEVFIASNKNHPLRFEACNILRQINFIEQTMEYITEIKNSYQNQIAEVMKNTMSMETFMERLIEIDKCLSDLDPEEYNHREENNYHRDHREHREEEKVEKIFSAGN